MSGVAPIRARGPKGRRHGSVFLVAVVVTTAVPSFALGALWSAVVMGVSSSSSSCSGSSSSSSSTNTADALQLRLRELETLCKDHHAGRRAILRQAERIVTSLPNANASLFPSEAVGRFAVAMARTSKQEFTDRYDMGVPLNLLPSAGAQDILLLYGNAKALPGSFGADLNSIPSLTAPSAVENCDFLNIVLTDHGQRRQCVAIVPQYESYHVQKWMRADGRGKLDRRADLRMVSRGHQANGKDQFSPPDLVLETRKHWTVLQRYFVTVDDVMRELKPILRKIAVRNTVIVMACNFGQSELLINFVCAARKRDLDTSNIIVFTTDQETTNLAESMGLTAYYDHRNFGKMPTEAAEEYGDARFVAMMLAKVICVQLVSMLGFDFLFQDVDIVWFKNPLDYFLDPRLPAHRYDVFFQDDGGHSVRYAPYSANSGFYFVRHNERTRHFLTSLLMAGDLVLSTNSHQQALIATLAEHVSLYGLKAKVLSRDLEEFPGGFQYHQRTKVYMKDFFAGKLHPFIFHMSWTHNKDNKILFFRQMGEWYVKDQCIQQKVAAISGANADGLAPTCCAAEPLFSCHYRDKPSVKPCKDSPPIDEGRPSWW